MDSFDCQPEAGRVIDGPTGLSSYAIMALMPAEGGPLRFQKRGIGSLLSWELGHKPQRSRVRLQW
jgi:hypothetical protein